MTLILSILVSVQKISSSVECGHYQNYKVCTGDIYSCGRQIYMADAAETILMCTSAASNFVRDTDHNRSGSYIHNTFIKVLLL